MGPGGSCPRASYPACCVQNQLQRATGLRGDPPSALKLPCGVCCRTGPGLGGMHYSRQASRRPPRILIEVEIASQHLAWTETCWKMQGASFLSGEQLTPRVPELFCVREGGGNLSSNTSPSPFSFLIALLLPCKAE